MNTTLYFKEMKRNIKRSIIWIGTIVFFILIIALLLPAMGDMMSGFADMIPEAMAKVLNMSAATWSTPLGMYTTYFDFYVLIFGGIYAAILGSTLIAKEEGEKTADFLLTRPMTRMEVVVSKLLVYVTYIILMNLILYAVTIVSFSMSVDNFEIDKFTTLTVYGFLYTFMIGLLTMFISLFMRRGKQNTSAAIGIVVGFYFIKVMSEISDKTEAFGYISPNKFVDSGVTSASYSLNPGNILYFIILSVFFIAGVFLVYRRKDLYT